MLEVSIWLFMHNRSEFASFPSGKTTRFSIKTMKPYEVIENVIEGMEKGRGHLCETGCNRN